jgi:hypothetical protein
MVEVQVYGVRIVRDVQRKRVAKVTEASEILQFLFKFQKRI